MSAQTVIFCDEKFCAIYIQEQNRSPESLREQLHRWVHDADNDLDYCPAHASRLRSEVWA
jgi:hypothetical protein